MFKKSYYTTYVDIYTYVNSIKMSRAWGALKSVLSNRGLGIKRPRIVYTKEYGAEAWGMRSAERRKVNVLEMTCFEKFGWSVANG